jgi:hypothetical protein
MTIHLSRARAAFAALCLVAAPLAAVPAAAQAGSQGDRDLAAISSYTLSMPRYRQYLDAMLRLANAAKTSPAIGDAFENSGSLSLDQMVARFDKVPEVRQAVVAAGLTSRDFVLTQMALFQTGMAYSMMKEYKLSADSVAKTAKVSRANLEFYRTNEAEIARLGKELEAKMPQSEESDDAQADGDEAEEQESDSASSDDR